MKFNVLDQNSYGKLSDSDAYQGNMNEERSKNLSLGGTDTPLEVYSRLIPINSNVRNNLTLSNRSSSQKFYKRITP